MNATPLVSVVVATYNMGRYVCTAVDSVLQQDYPELEVVVVDDGSTDDTAERLARYGGDARVRIFRQDNAGQTVAKNRGLSEARGEMVGFCDADNYWLQGKLRTQINAFSQRPDLGVVYGELKFIDGEGNNLPASTVTRYSGRITAQLLLDNFVTFNTTLVPRRILEEIGGFDESLSMAIDYDLWLRISVRYEFLYLPRPLVAYRIWNGQMSHRTGERFDNFFRLFEKFLANHGDCVTSAEIRKGWAHTYVSRGRWRASQKQYVGALSDYTRAFRYRPHDIRLLKSLTKLALGK